MARGCGGQMPVPQVPSRPRPHLWCCSDPLSTHRGGFPRNRKSIVMQHLKSTPLNSIALFLSIGVINCLTACGAKSQDQKQDVRSEEEELVATAGSQSAPLAARNRAEWRRAMSKTPLPKKGCFDASYPGNTWRETRCVPAPQIPYRHASGAVSETVGDGTDYSATAWSSGTIADAEGNFRSVTGVTNATASTFSLQLNTNVFSSPSACSGAANPSACSGWQQFIYSNYGKVFMQYWLINYANTCPAGWYTYGNDCWKNSMSKVVPVQSITNLSNLVLFGSTASGGTDMVTFQDVSDNIYATGDDSVLNVAQGWTVAEFNIFGDGNGSQLTFNSGVTLVAQTAITMANGMLASPTCTTKGTTGETNNLNLVASSCCPVAGTVGDLWPTIWFTESNAAGVTTPFCLQNDLMPILSPLLQ